jgi:hypothetical protein
MTSQRRSKLDVFSQALLVLAIGLFIASACCYGLSIYLYYTGTPGVSPTFTLTQIGNFAGAVGMIFVPLFIMTATIVHYREVRREKTGKDIDDDYTEPGTAGGS